MGGLCESTRVYHVEYGHVQLQTCMLNHIQDERQGISRDVVMSC